MIGTNKITLNEPSVKQALQEYLNRRLVPGGAEVQSYTFMSPDHEIIVEFEIPEKPLVPPSLDKRT